MKSEIISLNTRELTTRAFKDKRLSEATKTIMSIYQDAATYADTKNREIAKVLGTVGKEESYKADGFKSVAEYAEKVFGIQRANAYALSNAGKIYNDEKVSDKLKALSPSKLVEVSKVDAPVLLAALESGEVSNDKTQKELREFAQKAKGGKKKVEVVETFTSRPCMEFLPDVLIACSDENKTLDEWHTFYSDFASRQVTDGATDTTPAEMAKLPKSEYKINGKQVLRYLYFTRHFSIVVEYSVYKAPSAPSAPPAPVERDFTIEELEQKLAELKAAAKMKTAAESAKSLTEKEGGKK